MSKPHPIELRERVVAHVEEGHTHTATAQRFKVSIKFVNDMVKLQRETGSLAAKRQGRPPGRGKLAPHADWLLQRIAAKGDITLDALSLELAEQFGVTVHPTNVGRFVHRLGLSHKKRHFTRKSNTVLM